MNIINTATTSRQRGQEAFGRSVVQALEPLERLQSLVAAGPLSNLYLVCRHALAFSNLSRTLISSMDYEPDKTGLPAIGLDQARQLGRDLALLLNGLTEPQGTEIRIVTSPLPRAHFSAVAMRDELQLNIAGPHAPLPELIIDPRIREREWGTQFEGQPVERWSEIRDADCCSRLFPELESQESIFRRCAELVIEAELQPGRIVILVTHADVAQAIQLVTTPLGHTYRHYSELSELGNGKFVVIGQIH